jgi:FkbH-like protein
LNPNKTADLDYRRLTRLGKKAASVETDAPALKIALLSDAATQQFVPVLTGLFAENDIRVVLYEGAFDAIELEVFDQGSRLYAFKPDVVLLINAAQALRARLGERTVASEAERIGAIWDRLATHCTCRIIQCNFALPLERPFGQYDLKLNGSLYAATRLLNSQVHQMAAEKPHVLICDIEGVSSYVGRQHWFDERLWDMSKTFCSLEYLPFAAQAMVDIVLAAVGKVVKCVIIDLDNTLWGGVVGDLGPLGIQIGAHGDGEPFWRLQHYLLSLKKRGILLAACSKNELSNALAPFEQNPDMVLKRDDFTVFIANWDNKADNIGEIRETLEIGLDSMVFLDDNPFERNLVRRFLPDVLVPELPEDPADYVRYISGLNLFETTAFSAEDVARSTLYKQESERREARRTFTDVNDYLRSLDMQIVVSRFEPHNIGRIAQLFLRSNQFNLTTHRYTEAECTQMMLDEEHCIPLSATLRDRFGDYGLISLVVAWSEGDTLRISDWLMSCRVLGRGVEQFLMNRIVQLARQRGLSKLSGEYIPTAKNGMVKEFWAQFGFDSPDGLRWVRVVSNYTPHVAWIGDAAAERSTQAR